MILLVALVGCATDPNGHTTGPTGGVGVVPPAPTEATSVGGIVGEDSTSTESAATDPVVADLRAAGMKGPTGMGLAHMIADGWSISLHGSPDEVTPALIRGDLDIAAIPANLAAVLAAKTDHQIQVFAVTTLGVLSVVERGDSIHAVADLAGRTVVTTGKGSTPQHVTEHLLDVAGLSGQVQVEYRSEASEVAAGLVAGLIDLAILPEPYVSTVLAKDPGLRVGVDLTEQWASLVPGSQIVSAVLAVRREFVQNRPEAVRQFATAYANSVEFTNANPEQAGAEIAAAGIVADPGVAADAIGRSHIVDLTGDAMRGALAGYLGVLYEAQPESVGGSMPPPEFYLSL
jgi:NitT/TauT family transport system substrate-binding protein